MESLAHPSVQHATPDESIEIVGLTHDELYEFRVRARKPYDGSHLYSLWSDTLPLIAPTPTLWQGHQEDHTVAYEIGPIPTPWAELPDEEDPGVVIPAAIKRAAAAWNTAAMAIAGKNLKICKVMKEGDACDVSNHDMGTVTVKTEDTNTKDTGAANHDPDQGCGPSIACVKLGIPSSSSPSSNGLGNHLRDLSLIIEEPAWECSIFDRSGACAQHDRIYWTDTSEQNRHRVPGLPHGSPPSFYYYIGATMIHEFGHTLGLPDFGTDPTLKNWPAVMEDTHSNMTITDEDIAQLRAIYAIHESSDH